MELDVASVSKAFAGVSALVDVSMSLRGGEVHALIGENGAGKSTLINVLAGVLAPDAGTLRRGDGTRLRLASPLQAMRHGIAVIHQEPQLVASMSALDNLFIGERFPRHGPTPFIARRRMREQAQACCATLGFELPLARPVAELSATQRTLLALLRCLMREPDWLILDEPTAALTNRDAQHLLGLVDALRRRGKCVLYVSHRLDEVLQIADRITVLRNGRRVGSFSAGTQTRAGLIEAMSGRSEAAHTQGGAAAVRGAPLLELDGIGSRDGRVRDATLSLHAGEMLGLYGLAGSGRTELLETLVGLRALARGQVRLRGEPLQSPIEHSTPRQAAARGVVLLPEDRRAHALVMGMRVRENLTLPFLARFARAGLVARRPERAQALQSMHALDIKATGPEQIIAELSGGNQQKVVFARALAMAPTVLLCDEPTQAVDVGVRAAIHELLREHRARGGAVLVVSSDLDEMLGLTDRIVVLRDGVTVAALDNRGLSGDDVLRWCFGPARAVPGGTQAPAMAPTR